MPTVNLEIDADHSYPKARVRVWYDGGCPLCQIEIALFKRLDHTAQRVQFIDLEGEGTCPLDRADMLAKFHAQEGEGPILVGMAAFGAMWRQVTPFQPLGWLAKVPPILWLMDLIYKQFLRVRPRLQAFVRGKTRAQS